MAKTLSKEVKIGAAFIIALFLLYFGINFLKGINIFKPANSYIVEFDNVTGLLIADPVTINGMKIGHVQSMELNSEDLNKVLVTLQMDKDFKINKGSRFVLESGLLGGGTLILEPNFSSTAYYIPGDTLTGTKKKGMTEIAEKLVPKLENMLPKLDSILSGVNNLVNDESLGKTLNNAEQMTLELGKSAKELNTLLAQFNGTMPTLNKSFDNLAQMTDKMKDVDIKAMTDNIDNTLLNLKEISDKINSKDNNIGLLFNDRQMYDSINSLLGNTSMLLQDMRKDPSKYINIKVF